jgi:hypothetical protein
MAVAPARAIIIALCAAALADGTREPREAALGARGSLGTRGSLATPECVAGDSLAGAAEPQRLKFAAGRAQQCWHIKCVHGAVLLHFLPKPYDLPCNNADASDCAAALAGGTFTCAGNFAAGKDHSGMCDTTCGYCVDSLDGLQIFDEPVGNSRNLIELLEGTTDYHGAVAAARFGAASGKMTLSLNVSLTEHFGDLDERFAAEFRCGAVVRGCTDSTSSNYHSDATVDDGSCDRAALIGALQINEGARAVWERLDHPWTESGDVCAFTGVKCSLQGGFLDASKCWTFASSMSLVSRWGHP